MIRAQIVRTFFEGRLNSKRRSGEPSRRWDVNTDISDSDGLMLLQLYMKMYTWQ